VCVSESRLYLESLASTLSEVSGKIHAPGAFIRRMCFWCPLNNWRRGGLQIRFGSFEEGSSIMTLQGIESGSLRRPSHNLVPMSICLWVVFSCLRHMPV